MTDQTDQTYPPYQTAPPYLPFAVNGFLYTSM